MERFTLRCIECGCVSDDGRGWRGYLSADLDQDADLEVAVYCPACSHREFGDPPELAGFA